MNNRLESIIIASMIVVPPIIIGTVGGTETAAQWAAHVINGLVALVVGLMVGFREGMECERFSAAEERRQ